MCPVWKYIFFFSLDIVILIAFGVYILEVSIERCVMSFSVVHEPSFLMSNSNMRDSLSVNGIVHFL